VAPSRQFDADEPTVETDRTAVAPPREQNVASSPQLDADEPTVETDRTAVASPREQNMAPPRQLGADEPTVETDRTAVASPREQNMAPPRQLGADEPIVETDRTAVAPPREHTVAPPLQLGIDERTVETDRTAVAPPREHTVALPSQLGADEPTVETDRTAVAPSREQNVAPSRQLDADEIAALLKRGEDLIRSGDLAAARLVLQRATEAKSAEVALTLAATYDPVILRELRVYGFASDFEKATDRTAVVPEQDVAPSRRLDADEIATLLKRGEDLIRSGDLAAARLVLQRAAEAKSAEAALALAATYDPVILRELRVYGLASDVGMARSWYAKAKEFGSAAASQLLEILISAAR
jgi:hypothetical protein